jgi:cyclic pyranopterin phosphate synthase
MARRAKTLTHLSARGEARMVDVSTKPATERVAVAEGRVVMTQKTLDVVRKVTRKRVMCSAPPASPASRRPSVPTN